MTEIPVSHCIWNDSIYLLRNKTKKSCFSVEDRVVILEYCKSLETQGGAFKIFSLELLLNIAQLLHSSSHKLKIIYGYLFASFHCIF